MMSFLFFIQLTKPGKLLQSKKEISRQLNEGIRKRDAYGLYYGKHPFDYFDTADYFYIIGSIIWTFSFVIFFEIIFIIFMIISFIFNKKYFRKFYDCLNLLCYASFSDR